MANRLGGFEGEDRWGNFLGVPKHLISINGIPLIHLIQKQLKFYKFSDVNIICQESDKKDYIIGDTKWIDPSKSKPRSNNPDHEINVCKAFFTLSKSNLILFGDNLYTHNFFKKVLNSDENTWQYYARPYASKYVNKPYQEGFAWYIVPNSIKTLIMSTDEASNFMQKKYGGIQQGLSIRESYDFAEEKSNDRESHLVVVDDETTDFDFPHEWDYWSNKFMEKIEEIIKI